jgi:SAM-dependent methyltransferase
MTFMRLNLGCGDERLPGHVNVDLRPDVADVVADVRRLPFRDGRALAVHAADILEHLPASDTARALAEWRRVLAPGGRLTVKAPNMLALSRGLLDADERGRPGTAQLLIRNVFGGHRWGPDGAWDAHHTGFTPATLAGDLKAAGFLVESNDLALNMTVVAIRT